MKKYNFLLSFLVLTGFSQNVLANYYCTGKVSYLGLDSGGDVVVELNNSGRIHAICNLDSRGSFKMVISACKVAYGTLLASQSSENFVTLYYADNPYTCDTIPAWGRVPEFYFIERRA